MPERFAEKRRDYIPVRAKDGLVAIDAMSKGLRPGGITLIVGAWGSGKTELLRQALRKCHTVWWGESDHHDSMRIQKWLGTEGVQMVSMNSALYALLHGPRSMPVKQKQKVLVIDGDSRFEQQVWEEAEDMEKRLKEWDVEKYNPLCITVSQLQGIAWRISKMKGVNVVRLKEPTVELCMACMERWCTAWNKEMRRQRRPVRASMTKKSMKEMIMAAPSRNLTALATNTFQHMTLVSSNSTRDKECKESKESKGPDLLTCSERASTGQVDGWNASTEWEAATQLLNGSSILRYDRIDPEDHRTWPLKLRNYREELTISAEGARAMGDRAEHEKLLQKREAWMERVRGQIREHGDFACDAILRIARRQPGGLRIAEHNRFTQMWGFKDEGTVRSACAMLDDAGDADVFTSYTSVRGVQSKNVTAGDQDEAYTIPATAATLVRGLSLATHRSAVRKKHKVPIITPSTSFRNISPPGKAVHTAKKALMWDWKLGIQAATQEVLNSQSWAVSTAKMEDATERAAKIKARKVTSTVPLPKKLYEEVARGTPGPEMLALQSAALQALHLRVQPTKATWGVGWNNGVPCICSLCLSRFSKSGSNAVVAYVKRSVAAWGNIACRNAGWRGVSMNSAPEASLIALQHRLKPVIKGIHPVHFMPFEK